MRSSFLMVLLAAVAHSGAAFNLGFRPARPNAAEGAASSAVGNRRPGAPERVSTSMSGKLNDAWVRYVLIRPDGDNGRVPGTARTFIFSTFAFSVLALPYLLTRPEVLPELVEAAAASRSGINPLDLIS